VTAEDPTTWLCRRRNVLAAAPLWQIEPLRQTVPARNGEA